MVTREQMLARIKTVKLSSLGQWAKLTNDKAFQAEWDAIEAAVLRDCERHEAERAAEANGRKAA